jgi:hypothetical protein
MLPVLFNSCTLKGNRQSVSIGKSQAFSAFPGSGDAPGSAVEKSHGVLEHKAGDPDFPINVLVAQSGIRLLFTGSHRCANLATQW